MLTRLEIRNFALIEHAAINFTGGFTVITGETGSGKSILLNALHLLMGDRSSSQVIGSKGEKAVVEALFDLSHLELTDFFKENDLDFELETVVRRELNLNGKSRAFINDVPVSLTLLKSFSSKLLHIHSQFNTLELKSTGFQMDVLDILAENYIDRRAFEIEFRTFQKLKKDLDELVSQQVNELQRQDYNRFQLEEIQRLNLSAKDYHSLSAELVTLEHASELTLIFSQVADELGGELGVNDKMRQLLAKLDRFKNIHAGTHSLSERLQTLLIELRDIEAESESLRDSLHADEGTINELKLLIDEYNRILFKHRRQNQHELMAYQNELEASLKVFENLDEDITTLRRELAQKETELLAKAERMHSTRLTALPAIEKNITDLLAALKLPDTRLIFRLVKRIEMNAMGISDLDIWFSANPGIEPVPIHQAASGGELSRLMLTIQRLIATNIRLSTILFDEIDTGVSGDVAGKMGELLRDMGQTLQVIAVTHLPQVAALGTQHFKVVKDREDGLTKTKVLELTPANRIQELATMLSGAEVTDAAIEHAKALMK